MKIFNWVMWTCFVGTFCFVAGVKVEQTRIVVEEGVAKPPVLLEKVDILNRNDGLELFYNRETGEAFIMPVKERKE